MTHKWMATLFNGHSAFRQRTRNFPEHPAPVQALDVASRSRDEILEALRAASTFGAHEHATWLIAAIESADHDPPDEEEGAA